MYGRLYYSPNLYTTGSSELLNCVDLKTGQLLWSENTTSFYNAAPGASPALGTSSTANTPQFGYYYSEDTPNEHGIDNPGWLFSTNYGIGYQPALGIPELHIANVPGSTQPAGAAIAEIQGPAGENLRYVFVNYGTTAAPNYYLMQWNSSKVIPGVYSGPVTSATIEGNVPLSNPIPTGPAPLSSTGAAQVWSYVNGAWVGASSAVANNIWNGTTWVNAATAAAQNIATPNNAGSATPYNQYPSFDWNITSPIQFAPVVNYVTGVLTPASVTIAAASITNGLLWGWNATGATAYGASANGWPTGTSGPNYAYPANVTVWAIDINPSDSNFGHLLYSETLTTDTNDNQNIMIEHADADATSDGVFVTIAVPTMQFSIYDMRTGQLNGQTDIQSQTITPYGYYTWPSLISLTQTKIAYGMLFTGGYGGSISAYYLNNASLAWRTAVIPPGTAGVIKSSPGMMSLVADGMVYVGVHEHSAETPLEAGNMVKDLNATTGAYIWEMSGWMYPLSSGIADGVLVYYNDYDAQIYAVGQGPSQTMVNAPSESTIGNSVTISGSVYDVSAGTSQSTVKADFPNGVPAVSDASESAWMEYVYMQKAEPTNITGVTVQLSVTDSNGNTYPIGTTTTDQFGHFSFQYKPTAVTGLYKVTATFAGSNSYYGSADSAAFSIDAAAPTPMSTTTQTVAGGVSNNAFYGAVAAIIVVIVIVGAAIILLMRKKP